MGLPKVSLLTLMTLLQVLELARSSTIQTQKNPMYKDGLDPDNEYGYLDFETIQTIMGCCPELTGFTLLNNNLSKTSINYLVNRLPPKIEILFLGGLEHVKDDHVKILVSRLKKLKNLDLSGTGITGKSLASIIEYAKENLVTLNIAHTSKIKLSKFLELKSLTNLKYLCCDGCLKSGEIKILEKKLPNLSIKDTTDIMCEVGDEMHTFEEAFKDCKGLRTLKLERL